MKINKLILLGLIGFICLNQAHLYAQWTKSAYSEGGKVTCFAAKGIYLFAGTEHGGIFRSTDNGTSWTAVNNGLTNTGVNGLAVSGTNLFAGTEGDGVFLLPDAVRDGR